MGQNDKWMGQNDKWMRQNDKWTGQKTGQNDNEIASLFLLAKLCKKSKIYFFQFSILFTSPCSKGQARASLKQTVKQMLVKPY